MRNLTQQDAYVLMNELVHQATGRNDISVVDTSSFVSAGETLLAAGTENVLNALSLIIGRTLVAARPYSGKLNILNAINTGMYTHRLRKISFYSRDAEPAGDWNTQFYTNLKDGFDNTSNSNASAPSMWKQNQPVPLEMNFAGSDVWQDSTTVYLYQLKQAFRDETSFNDFVAGIMIERENDIESQKEAFRRMTLLNHVAACASMGVEGVNKINLTKAYNDEFGTSYTTQQLLSGQYRSFYEFFIALVRKISDRLTDRTSLYHWTPARSDGLKLLRHTPKDRQRMIIYKPIFIDAEARVFPEVFNENYIKESNWEGVNYWQSPNSPQTINITPAVPTDQGYQATGTNFNPQVLVGVIYDVDGVMVDYQLEDALATPIEARKRYYNLWYSFAFNAISDQTENCVVLYMDDTDEATLTLSVPTDAQFGKAVSDIQTDVHAVGTNLYGTLKYITGWTEFSQTPALQSGNYVALHVESPINDATITVQLIGGTDSAKTLDETGDVVARIHDSVSAIKFVVSASGYDSKTYIFNTDTLTKENPT